MASSNMLKPFAKTPLIVLLGIAAVWLYWVIGSTGKVEEAPIVQTETGLKRFSAGAMAAFLSNNPPKDIAAFSFQDGAGVEKSLGDFKGRVILLNLWATWCAPCRKEMPDINQLQMELGGADFEVIALSLDRKGLEASAAFLKVVKADSLKLYIDTSSKSLSALKALGLPATLLIDRQGREVGRLLGPAQWSSPEAKALITAVIAQK